MNYGQLKRAYLGVLISEITEEFARTEGLEDLSGVYVADVVSNGAAKRAGIKQGDIILSINDIPVDTRSQLIGTVAQYRPKDTVDVKVKRGDKIMVFEVTLTEYKN